MEISKSDTSFKYRKTTRELFIRLLIKLYSSTEGRKFRDYQKAIHSDLFFATMKFSLAPHIYRIFHLYMRHSIYKQFLLQSPVNKNTLPAGLQGDSAVGTEKAKSGESLPPQSD